MDGVKQPGKIQIMLARKNRSDLLPCIQIGYIQHTQTHAVQRVLHATEQLRLDALLRQPYSLLLKCFAHSRRISALAAEDRACAIRNERIIHIKIASEQPLLVQLCIQRRGISAQNTHRQITDQTAAQTAFSGRNRYVLKADHALRQRHLHFARHNQLMDFRAALAVMTLTDLGCVLR